MKLLSSLTNRIFLASAALAVLSIGFAVYFVSVRATREAEAELQRGLIEAGTLVDQHRATLVQTFTVMARIVADSPKLKAAVETDDPPTVQPLAQDYQAQVGSNLLVVTNRRGRVLAAIGQQALSGEAIAALPDIRSALAGTETSGFWAEPDDVLQVVTVPIAIGLARPEILGTLSVGFRLDNNLAAQFKSLTDSDVAFAVDGQIRAATLPAADQPLLTQLLGSQGISTISIDGSEYVALLRPLTSGLATGGANGSAAATGPAPAANPRAPIAIILRSRTERLRFLDAIHTGLAGTAVVAVLLATILSYAVARTITRPLATITDAMREMATTGDLTRKIPLRRTGSWEDEDARLLAATFNTLIESIARFQREASQRERLSSLGRLSTVVAHEVRNPLMIIKASLRTMRRDTVTPEDAREALTDIDEEIARLNRVVNDVLDFARPIHFEFAPADFNAICVGAVEATRGGEHEPAIRVATDPSLPPIVTDAERLRTALVNIMTNARHAVAAAEQPAGGGAHRGVAVATLSEIDVSTARRAPGHVAVIVRDRGSGIRPEDLPRVFDPYFTTKRTGTGLGLPIAKNIIEGLGGSITVESRPGEGTEIRVELPERPPESQHPTGVPRHDAPNRLLSA